MAQAASRRPVVRELPPGAFPHTLIESRVAYLAYVRFQADPRRDVLFLDLHIGTMPVFFSHEETSVLEAEAFDPHNGLNSTDGEEVLAYYQWAAAFNDKNQYAKTLALISMDSGNEKLNKYMEMFEPIAKKAVAKNSVSEQALPGKYKTIRPSDWSSAKAVTDGT